MQNDEQQLDQIAIVGMEARLPGASTLEKYWQNLRDGVESVRILYKDVPKPKSGLAYVQAVSEMDEIERFDAQLFGFTPREAEQMDPQVRVFLESVWAVLEHAGYDPAQYAGRIGVFAGAATSTYLLSNLMTNPDIISGAGMISSLSQFNDRDSLCTIASYKLNLTGPSVTLQTFCSTSLVAVHFACQSLFSGESDLAIAGGVSINASTRTGYVYQEGGIFSPDGHCRSFDAASKGTIFGSGIGLVALKRLEDALNDGDTIHAVIKATVINNDGSRKAGYTAPSVVGQSKAIAEALALSQIDPETISYLEAHGTGTEMGDPIELEALTRAFRTVTDKKQFCAIGSAKSNFGHLDRAAGAAGLIKTVLSMQHRQIPPSLHYKTPNPKIDFENSPFIVNTQLRDWQANGYPLRAGVSALGVGGTNAHVIVEEAPKQRASGPGRVVQLLPLATNTESVMPKASANLAEFLAQHPDAKLADVAYTLQFGRARLPYRRIVVAADASQAIEAIKSEDPQRVFTGFSQDTDRPVVFMFPGQGAQYPNMTRGLYESEPVFSEAIDQCAKLLEPMLGQDLRGLLYPDDADSEQAGEKLKQTSITQPALFVIEYALVKLLMAWGIKPESFIGHSIGQYVAAHLAEVFSLEDVLRLVAERGRLMQQVDPGAMMAIPMAEEALVKLLPTDVSLAVVNAPGLCVVSGPIPAIDAFEAQLKDKQVMCRCLHTSHAFHSAMMDPILDAFTRVFDSIKLSKPKVPFITNVTGTWIQDHEATDPGHWVKHLRQTVRFGEGIQTLWSKPKRILLEVGPGNTLCTLARQQAQRDADPQTLASIRHPKDPQDDLTFLLSTLGRLWIAGAKINFKAFYKGQKRVRIPLPTYPFDHHERYWVEPGKPQQGSQAPLMRLEPDRWFYVPRWRSTTPSDALPTAKQGQHTWLLFVDAAGLGQKLATQLRHRGHRAITVTVGDEFAGGVEEGFVIDPTSKNDYVRLFEAFKAAEVQVDRVVHGWSVTEHAQANLSLEEAEKPLATGYFSLLKLAQALGQQDSDQSIQLKILSSQMHTVIPGETIHPQKSTLLGLAKVIPQEIHHVTCTSIDVDPANDAIWDDTTAVNQLLAELDLSEAGDVVAYRKGRRYLQWFEPLTIAAPTKIPAQLREQGVYLITGGLGGVGFALTNFLAGTLKAKLVMTGRSQIPPRDQWPNLLENTQPNDPIVQKIRRIQALEQAGAQVHTVSADAGDLTQMRAAFESAEKRFGIVHGVIHAAGIVTGDTFRPVAELDEAVCLKQLHPKLTGLLVLEKAIGERKLDFCMLTSSLSSVLGGLSYGAYSAANIFMDAFTTYHNQQPGVQPWLSINWDEWRLTEQEPEEGAQGLARFAMSPSQGAGAFARAIQLRGVEQVIVSTGTLEGRVRQWIKLEVLRKQQQKQQKQKEAPRYQRPNLQNSYVAPGTKSQRQIAAIWQELLGIDKVGIQDNFFELGGHSLLAIQVVGRIKVELGANISVATLFEGPTVHSLCQIIENMLKPQATATAEKNYDQSSDRGKKRKEQRRQRQRGEKIE